jgi:hypothetical protein
MLNKNQTKMTQENDQLVLTQEKNQYNLWQILTLWLAGSALMWIMGWGIYPALSRNVPVVEAGLLRMKLLTVGLIWQFVLSMIILYLEEGNLRLATIRRRFWLNNPISPKSGQKDNRLWWLLIPFLLLVILLEFAAGPFLNGLWIWRNRPVTVGRPCSPLSCGRAGSAHGTCSLCSWCSPFSIRSSVKNSCSTDCSCQK